MKSLFLCHVRGYLAHFSFCALIYSYVIQALYRLLSTIYYHRIYFQHFQMYMYAIGIQWIFAFLQTLPIEFGNNQIFIEEEYLCQIAIENSIGIGYINSTNYLLPVTIIMIMYYIIAKSVRQKNSNGTYKYNIHRARRQLVLTQRILILIAIVLVLGGPYTVFILLEMFSIRRAPPYSHRVGFMFISISAALSIATIICFTQSVLEIIIKFFIIKKKQQMKNKIQRMNRFEDIELIPSTA
ncbi:unnamed protein product [Rotaria sordida]|uniref:G-protein coupled receptors family 1 profile domain-containing protein n=1 Tax=Rotaria sordida TaxID=392033 RepID=A0A819LVD5_9BILA|nr:unnamed protein product [Rotaria sordida]CAF3969950.1 unnamed protein product [Rotaria sordida]